MKITTFSGITGFPGSKASCAVYFARNYDLKEGTFKYRLAHVQPTWFFGVPRVWEKMSDAMQALGAKNTGMKKRMGALSSPQRKAVGGFLDGDNGNPFGDGGRAAYRPSSAAQVKRMKELSSPGHVRERVVTEGISKSTADWVVSKLSSCRLELVF